MTFQEMMTFLGMKFFQVLISFVALFTGIGQLFIIVLVLFVVSWLYFIYCATRKRTT